MRVIFAFMLIIAAAVVALWQTEVLQVASLTPSSNRSSSVDIFTIAREGTFEQLRASLQAGANVHAQDSYAQTPLMYAASHNESPAVISELINAGADVNARTEAGWTALMYAARDNSNPDIILTLLNAGANPSLRDSDNNSAFQHAASNRALQASPLYRSLEALSARSFDPMWPSGYTVPIAGATFSSRASHLAGARRAYRNGWHEGYDFYDGVSSVPIVYGTPVIAAANGVVIRADHGYQEVTLNALQAMLAEAARLQDTPADTLDILRGKQVWIEHIGGFVTRYAHLSGIPENIQPGVRVSAGQRVGYVGNSGTAESAAGTQDDPHLHFELWRAEAFMGQDMQPDAIYERIGQVFGQAAVPPVRGN